LKGILADVNIQGQMDALVVVIQAEPWKLFWDYLSVKYLHFSDIALLPSSPDSVVWQTCQDGELVLITDNRNQHGTDSLETTIRSRSTSTSLPVFTISDTPRLRTSRDYADRVIETLLDSLLRIDDLRGSGRLFLP
jgi:hypothetical protein